MNHRPSAVLVLTGLILACPLFQGCAKRFPPPGGKYDVTDTVVLTLKDGRTVQGHIDPGRRVEYRNGGSLYRADVISVSKEGIKLDHLQLIDTDGSYELVSSRLSDARYAAGPPAPAVSVDSSEVQNVELVRTDTAQVMPAAPLLRLGELAAAEFGRTDVAE